MAETMRLLFDAIAGYKGIAAHTYHEVYQRVRAAHRELVNAGLAEGPPTLLNSRVASLAVAELLEDPGDGNSVKLVALSPAYESADALWNAVIASVRNDALVHTTNGVLRRLKTFYCRHLVEELAKPNDVLAHMHNPFAEPCRPTTRNSGVVLIDIQECNFHGHKPDPRRVSSARSVQYKATLTTFVRWAMERRMHILEITLKGDVPDDEDNSLPALNTVLSAYGSKAVKRSQSLWASPECRDALETWAPYSERHEPRPLPDGDGLESGPRDYLIVAGVFKGRCVRDSIDDLITLAGAHVYVVSDLVADQEHEENTNRAGCLSFDELQRAAGCGELSMMTSTEVMAKLDAK